MSRRSMPGSSWRWWSWCSRLAASRFASTWRFRLERWRAGLLARLGLDLAGELADAWNLADVAVLENRRLRELWRRHHPDLDPDIELRLLGVA